MITFVPDRFIYSPSTYLSASLTTASNDFYKITNLTPDLLWKINVKEKLKFENLHSFLWLTRLDRKNSKIGSVSKNPATQARNTQKQKDDIPTETLIINIDNKNVTGLVLYLSYLT